MFYFGRIISAFFNQLFRFLLWNKFGQKLLIIIIISLLAFWCLGMTKVHAVEEVNDINYEVQSYYDSVVNEAILRLNRYWDTIPQSTKDFLFRTNLKLYWFYGSNDGSSYNNAKPINNQTIYCLLIPVAASDWTATAYDYMGVTGYTMYTRVSNGFYIANNGTTATYQNRVCYVPRDFYSTYTPSNWTTFITAKENGDLETITALLEDIKAEQQATNDFLNEETDTSNMVIDTPSVTDAASENMSNNLHNQINTLTTDLQNTVNNYYEGWNAYTWSIPLPNYIGGNITFDSGVTRRIIGTSGVVYNIIQAIWVVLFGGYIVGFIKRMLDWVQTGKIFDEGGIADFIWWMDTNNEIIKASMM